MKASKCMHAGSLSATPLAGVALAAMLLPNEVVAQSESSARERADALFEHGKAALKAGDWKAACRDFQRSRELDESASTVVKIARCHEHDGHFVQALAEYDRALTLIRARPASDTHARDLESLIQTSRTAVEGRLGHLRIRLDPKPNRAVVLVDGQPIGTLENSQSEIVVPVEPGEHTVQIQAAGYTAPLSSVQVAERQLLDLSVPLLQASDTTDTPAAVQTTPIPPVPAANATAARYSDREPVNSTPTGGTQRVAGYVTGGAGVALALVAGYFGVRTRLYVDDARTDNHCDSNYRCDQRGLELIDDARAQQRNAIIAGISSGVLVTTGIVLIATAPAKRSGTVGPEKALAISMSPFGAAVRGQW